MGGDSFQGVEKLTNQQYQLITSQLIKILEPYCKRIEPYVPLPQKQVHGDVDFLVILKEQFTPKSIIQVLKMQQYKLNNNDTINSVYKGKQVDYCFVKTEKEFELMAFYKSYSGIGAYLGVFLPTKEIKVTPDGIVALGFEKHLKLEFVVCNDVKEILEFYGLDYERYREGFKTRKDLYEFIRGVRFLDQFKFAYHEHKAPTKLIRGLCQYLKQTGIKTQKQVFSVQNALQYTLEYFKKTQQYKDQFAALINSTKRVQSLNQKFNATHLFANFEVEAKHMNEVKKKFNKLMFDNDQDKYYEWVEKNQVETILKEFEEKCGLKRKGKVQEK